MSRRIWNKSGQLAQLLALIILVLLSVSPAVAKPPKEVILINEGDPGDGVLATDNPTEIFSGEDTYGPMFYFPIFFWTIDGPMIHHTGSAVGWYEPSRYYHHERISGKTLGKTYVRRVLSRGCQDAS